MRILLMRLWACTLIGLGVASAQPTLPEPTPASIAWTTTGEFCDPETVLPLPDNTLLVSNVCVSREDSNGFLTLLDKDGQVLDWRIVEDLDAPLGMALVDDRLYIVDNNKLVLLSWPGYEFIETIELETSVANDVAVNPIGVAYVTDTAKGQVVQVLQDGTQSVILGEARFPGANGIALDGAHLLVGGERLWRVNLKTGGIETIGPEWLADIDGIELEADGTIQLTPVGGPLVRYRGPRALGVNVDFEILGGDGISSANHGYAPNLQLALIPTGFDNTVIAIRVVAEP